MTDMVQGNGQAPLEVSQDAIIDGLLRRVQQLTIENVMLHAVMDQLRAGQAEPADLAESADVDAPDVTPS